MSTAFWALAVPLLALNWGESSVTAQMLPPLPVQSALPTASSQGTAGTNPSSSLREAVSPWTSPDINGNAMNANTASGMVDLAFQQPDGSAALDGYSPDTAQDAPGAREFSWGSVASAVSLPDYVYERSYYDTYDVGARPIADYAPPGYEARDYQDAPGVPEYRPISPPPRLTSQELGNYVTRGMMPGSFLVPGTNTSFRLRGFVRLAALYDFDPIGSTDSFVPNTIPVPQQVGQNFNMSGRISRFALETWTPTSFNNWNVHTFIEGDFFNGAAQAAGGGGNPFRLRHAFFDFGYFRFGQQNSVFMDPNNWASLVDFQGPNSWVNQRQPSVRMTLPVYDGLYWATSIERPFSDITTDGLGRNVQDVPDLATHLRYQGDVGHLQAAALLRTIGYRPDGGDVTRRLGVGVSGSAVFHPWALVMNTDPVHEANPSGLTRSRILLQGTWGPGTARYLNDLAGQGLDGQVDPVTGAFDLVNAAGWNASYEHWFNAHWLSNFTYSEAMADSNSNQPGTTYQKGKYVAASLWWTPITRLSFGIEYMWGQRENVDQQRAEAQRLHGLFQYNF
ncbi:MAG TPA: DcaP family trimeric outer membrane transporter [Planctomicrobium sp.]|nr:DcaP family trimeric outer membrane transporter [Planctomicrobium sp.]